MSTLIQGGGTEVSLSPQETIINFYNGKNQFDTLDFIWDVY